MCYGRYTVLDLIVAPVVFIFLVKRGRGPRSIYGAKRIIWVQDNMIRARWLLFVCVSFWLLSFYIDLRLLLNHVLISFGYFSNARLKAIFWSIKHWLILTLIQVLIIKEVSVSWFGYINLKIITLKWVYKSVRLDVFIYSRWICTVL